MGSEDEVEQSQSRPCVRRTAGQTGSRTHLIENTDRSRGAAKSMNALTLGIEIRLQAKLARRGRERLGFQEGAELASSNTTVGQCRQWRPRNRNDRYGVARRNSEGSLPRLCLAFVVSTLGNDRAV